jgi:UDP-N-acetylglucosamine enolpyruvyl transferase
LPSTSPAEISKASAGSIVMMSSKAQATTSVSLGVAASNQEMVLDNVPDIIDVRHMLD